MKEIDGYCTNCREFKENPRRYISKEIGSRSSQTSVYWNDKIVQIVCRCFKGNLEEFEDRVNSVYPSDTDYYKQQYNNLINLIKYIIEHE